MYSGHNGYWYWGPPPRDTFVVRTVGYDKGLLEDLFDDVVEIGRLDNHRDIDNDEQGEAIHFCRGPRTDWDTMWDRFKDIGGTL